MADESEAAKKVIMEHLKLDEAAPWAPGWVVSACLERSSCDQQLFIKHHWSAWRV